jgi:hypothetical protein
MNWRTPAALAHLMDTRDEIRNALLVAMMERPDRQDTTASGELGWVVFERETLRDAVNQRRVGRGLEPATAQDIEALESQAAGHVDYADKLAYYCARLALGYEESER